MTLQQTWKFVRQESPPWTQVVRCPHTRDRRKLATMTKNTDTVEATGTGQGCTFPDRAGRSLPMWWPSKGRWRRPWQTFVGICHFCTNSKRHFWDLVLHQYWQMMTHRLCPFVQLKIKKLSSCTYFQKYEQISYPCQWLYSVCSL